MSRFAKAGAVVALLAAVLSLSIGPIHASPAHAGASILVWSHLEPSEIKLAQQLANQWAATTGNTVKVIADPTSGFQGFATTARSGKGPDIEWGLPADNIGTFQLAGLIAPVPTGIFTPTDFVPGALPAVSFGGRKFAVPIMLDTYTLVYNKSLVKTPPTTWDQLISIAQKFPNTKDGGYGFLFNPANFYFAYAFIKGYGGYIFKQNGATTDTSDIGLGNAGTIKALQFFQDLVKKYKLIPPDVNDNITGSYFQKGKSAMWIDGDWDITNNQQALKPANFGAAPLPLLPGGLQMHPFAGVQVGFVSNFSAHQSADWSLIKYMLSKVEIPDWQASGRIPAAVAALDDPRISKDPIYSVYAKTALAGDPLPNVPEMQSVWGPGGNAITLVLQGKETPSQAAANMVKQIQQGIAQLNS